MVKFKKFNKVYDDPTIMLIQLRHLWLKLTVKGPNILEVMRLK